MYQTDTVVPKHTMNRDHIIRIFSANKITIKQRDALLRLVEDGVTDPCLSGVSPALAKLWYASIPVSKQRGASTATVRDLVLGKGGAFVHKVIASKLGGQFASCMALNTYLCEWLIVTRDTTILEAVAWRWLDAAGSPPDEPKESYGIAVTVDGAREQPQRLLKVLSGFKRQFSLQFSPGTLVDIVAITNEWWTTDSEARSDTFVFAAVEEALIEHEWISVAAITEHVPQITDVREAVDRLSAQNTLKILAECDGVTLPEIYGTCCSVRQLIDAFNTTDAPTLPSLETSTLTDEQVVLYDRVASGKRLTLCCAPAGTGKSHTAAIIGGQAPGPILCLAPTWKAISVLRQKLGHLTSVVFYTVQGFSLLLTPPVVSLVLVDEASMLTMSQIRRILSSYHDTVSTSILFMGDDAQLPCIGRGFPIRDIQTIMHTVRLTRCMRTNGRGLIEAATAVRVGSVIPESDEVIVDAALKPVDFLSRHYYQEGGVVHPPWSPDFVQMISPQNNHVDMLNEMAQQHLTFVPNVKPFSGCYVGDAVRLRENTETYKNGDEGILLTITTPNDAGKRKRTTKGFTSDARIGSVQLRDGRTVNVADRHMSPAYATTVHKVQGSEYSTVVLALFQGTHPNLRIREMMYTSVTRAVKKLHIVGHVQTLHDCKALYRRTVFGYVSG